MMYRSSIFAVAFFFAGMAFFSPAGQPQPVAEWKARSVRFSSSQLLLNDALAELQKQTGNRVEDRRAHPTNPKLVLPKDPGSFWSALDAIGKQNGIGFSQLDGEVVLVDSPYRELRTSSHETFRFTIKRISVVRDEDAQAHVCTVSMAVAWEPRLAPLYLTLDRGLVRFNGKGAQPEKLDRQKPLRVAESSVPELQLHMKAPDRSVASIKSLTGSIEVLGAPKMLEFTFDKLGPPKTAEQEGVKVSVWRKYADAKRWTVEVTFDYPSDPMLGLESYQSWMDNNRVWLQWTDPKTKVLHRLETNEQTPLEAGKRTKIEFHFRPKDKTRLPPNLGDGTLICRTPNRVVTFTVPFKFENLPLP